MKERTRTEYSFFNILTGIGGFFLNTVLGFVCRMVFVRFLSEDYLGINGLFTNILSMLSLAELGVGNAIVFALYKPLAEHNEEKIASLVNFYGKAYRIIGIAVALLGLMLLPFLNVIITEQPKITESIYVLYIINLLNTAGTYFFSYRSSLIVAAQQNYLVSGINYVVSILQSIIQMVFLVITKNYLLYLLIQTLGVFTYNIVISKLAVKKFPCIKSKSVTPLEKNEKKSIFRNIRDLMVYKISGLLVNSTDNILITLFSGLSLTGIASNYTLLVNTLTSLLSQVFNGLTASVGNHNFTETEDKKFEMFSFLNLMNFWIFGWAALGIVFCSGDIVSLCFGEKYILDISIPIIMAVNFYTVGMLNAVWTYKHTMGLFRYGRFTQIVTAIFNLTFSVLLGKLLGLFGILAATFISRLITNMWYDPFVIFKYGFKKNPLAYLKKYICYILVLSVAALLCYVAFLFVPNSSALFVIIRIIVCSIIANGVFCLFFHRTREFKKLKAIISEILNIFLRKIRGDCG